MKALSITLSVFFILFSACKTPLPDKPTEDYRAAIKSFYVGLAALQVGDDQRANRELTKASGLAKSEPAIWNNLGVLQMRQKKFEDAQKSLETAKDLDTKNAVIFSNIATLATQQGNFEKAVEYLNITIELEPKNIQAIYQLAQEKERAKADPEALKLYQRVLEVKPDNLAVQLEIARLCAKLGQKDNLQKTITEIRKSSENWSDEIKKQFDALETSAEGENFNQAATQAVFFRNVLFRDGKFRSSAAEIKPSDTSIGQLILKPLKLAVPDFSAAEADSNLQFTPQTKAETSARFAKAIFLNGEKSVIGWSNNTEIHIGEIVLPFGVKDAKGLTAFDFDYDYKNDLAIADENGFKLLKQTGGENFEEVKTKVSSTSFNGVWVLDVDNEGDLDLFLASTDGEPIVLQNNGDGTFTETQPFNNAGNVTDFVYADLDEDGDSDAILLDFKGNLQYFSNLRGGLFEERKLPELGKISAFEIGDANGDGKLDLILAKSDRVQILSDKDNGADFDLAELFKANICQSNNSCTMMSGDFDNNGGNDIVISADNKTSLFLSGRDGQFSQANIDLLSSVSNFAETNNDGNLDLVGIDANGRPTIFQNEAKKNYHWQILKPKAAKTEGDQRINTYGIGGEIEMRAGLLTQKQLITSPQVHFGLGEMANADVVRVVWQNGYVQGEFDLKSDQTVAAEQRLKGSCPHLFAWDGEKFAHVKDAPPWSPALGLKINAQDTYGILQTEEWFKIPGEALKPKEGFYELRITGEYWESFYLDNYKLLAVDHAENVETFTDERFSIPLPPLKVFMTETTKPFANATDHNGRDVLETVAQLDEKYLDGIKRGKFQGVAEDHFVELELPADAPRDKKLWVVADGWMHPTDASINVQRGQVTDVKPPKSLSIEVEHENGTWKTVKENLGFPAGKMKTVLLDLSDVFTKDAKRRRLRIRTELEVFWDKLAWAVDLDNVDNRTKMLDLTEANLRYRGFSLIEKRDDSSPEIPNYYKILTTNQRWRDLEGYYTRFGDVRELLLNTDDRIVLMNSGDELVLKFPSLPEVEKGMKRDFVIIGNGWIKDGDLNSVFSKTLLPLPTQKSNDYSRRPTNLEDDPVYQRNKQDWVNFHTRYVSPTQFRDALR